MASTLNRLLTTAILAAPLMAPVVLFAEDAEPIHGRYALPQDPFTGDAAFASPDRYTVVLAEGLSHPTAMELSNVIPPANQMAIRKDGEAYALCMGAWSSPAEATLAGGVLQSTVGVPPETMRRINPAESMAVPASPGTSFAISLGAWEAREQASAQLAALAEEGFVQLEATLIDGRHHILIGSCFPNEREASAELAALQELGVPGASLVAVAAAPPATLPQPVSRPGAPQNIALR